MRDKSLLKSSGGILHGYSVTPTSHIKKIFSLLDITEKDSFLDIGCGKGFVLSKVVNFPYNKIAGLDIQSGLITIAKQNMERLKLQNRICLFVEDATIFKHYGEYNHFFLFNPFDASIMKPVLEKIIDTHKQEKELTIIYYNPTCHDIIMQTGQFKLVHDFFDPIKGYKTHIYKSI
ncbi:MAG: methyltransferase domain-containing protein [Planctomycetaceae bacterium]|nr:methyltransferase domain-containing protein [Planctomycetaceae bacterium]